jgi:restriction endonuclease S subunit
MKTKNWEYKPLQEFLTPMANGKLLSQGWSPQCEKFPSKSENTWGVLKTTAIQPGKFEPEHNKELPKHLDPDYSIEVKSGDLLLTCAGPRNRCGVVCLVRETRPKLMLSGKIYRFRADEKKILPEFLEMYLLSPRASAEIDKMKTGISDSGLNLTHSKFLKLEIPDVPIELQREVLSQYEEIVERIRMVEQSLGFIKQKYSEYQRAYLHSLFFALDRLNQDSLTRELPEDWEFRPLKEVVLFNRPKLRDLKESAVEVSFVPMEKVEEATGFILLDKHISHSEGQRRSLTYFEDGDIIFAKITPCMENGKFAIAGNLKGGCAYGSTEFHVLTTNKELLPPYLYLFLSTEDFRAEAKRAMTGAVGQQRVPKSFLENYSFPLPPVPEQERLLKRIEFEFTRTQSLMKRVDGLTSNLNRLKLSYYESFFPSPREELLNV